MQVLDTTWHEKGWNMAPKGWRLTQGLFSHFWTVLKFSVMFYIVIRIWRQKKNSAGAVMNHNLWSKWRIVICFCQKRQVSACTAFTSYNSCNTRHNVTDPITDHQHQHQLQNQHQHHCSKTLNAPISMPCNINQGYVPKGYLNIGKLPLPGQSKLECLL